MAGVNPHARIMALKTANHSGQGSSADIARAIYYAVDRGARVINISYSGETPTRMEQRAIDYAVAQDVLVVVASGNQADDAARRGLAGAAGVLTVAGVGLDDKRAVFSNFGSPVTIAAPAMDVLGLRARGTDFLLYVGDNPNYQSEVGVVGKSRDLYRASGTSFAAPLVAGAASLLRSLRPEFTAAQVRRMLLMSADDAEAPGWDPNTGYGRLNLRKALDADPDHHLLARITAVRPARKDNALMIEVVGEATGDALSGRWMQIAFGDSPAVKDWTVVDFQRAPLAGGVLAAIPTARFNRQGTWSIRLLVQDAQQTVREARATLQVQ
jgi:hypothetical protein